MLAVIFRNLLIHLAYLLVLHELFPERISNDTVMSILNCSNSLLLDNNTFMKIVETELVFSVSHFLSSEVDFLDNLRCQ